MGLVFRRKACANAQAQRLAARRGPPELRDSTNLPPRRPEPTAAARSAPAPAPSAPDRAADGRADGTTRSTSRRARRASSTSACPSSRCTMRRAAAGRASDVLGGVLEAGCTWFDHSPSTPGRTSVSSWCASQQLGTTSARARAHSASTACARLYQQERIGEGTAERPGKLGRLTRNREEPWRRPARFGAPDTIPGGGSGTFRPERAKGP